MSPDGHPANTTTTDPGGGWAQRFSRRHLFDYTPAATRLWLAILLAGAAAFGWAVWRLAAEPPAQLTLALGGLVLVGLAALFPIQIPRTSHTVLVADLFIFGILSAVGGPAAVLAAGTEGLIGVLRSSKRLSSRLATPAASMLSMAACSGAFDAACGAVTRLGVERHVASLAALVSVALVPVALTTGALMWLVALKRGARLRLADWVAASGWVGALSLGAAFLAGLVQLNAQRYGSGVLGVAAALVFALVLLLRATLSRQEAARAVQDARLAEAQREADANQQRFTAAFTHAAIGMAIVKPDGCVLQVNRAFCTLLGHDEARLIGSPFGQLLHAGDDGLLNRQVAQVVELQHAAFSMELRCRSGAGVELWVVLHCSRYEDAGGAGHCLIYQLHDITSRHLAESRLHHIAYHDGLTDLANRNCFQERLEVAVERHRADAGAHPACHFAVLFLDLDRFKIVNDSLGHIAGNALLREVAQRLCLSVRPDDLVARLGGDEFAILLESLDTLDDGLRLADRVLQLLARPVPIDGTEVIPGASIGITFSDIGHRSVDEVLRDADLAMYEAKAAGRGRVAVFDRSMHERVAEKLALEADLRHAIGEGQLSVQFQPLFELEPYRICGFEALARWIHPQRGAVSPAVFIALAEECGQIAAVTDWMIDHAVEQLAHWQAGHRRAAGLGMHVNISGRDLARPELVQNVRQVLQRHRIAPEQLTLEITETTLMGRLDESLATLRSLREAGVRFSIDDFGTGYSSLAYLSTLPIDSLKIDRSFVMGLADRPENVEIVRAVLMLGTSLGHKVIAEGIETAEQLATLRSMGVHVGQGYLLSRPLRADQVPPLLKLMAPTDGVDGGLDSVLMTAY